MGNGTVGSDLGIFEACRDLRWAAPLPEMLRVRRHIEEQRVGDIDAAVREALAPLAGQVPSGASVAITAGSRGIASAPAIYRAVGRALTELGARPFLVAAMGSHGGGTAPGRLAVLEHLGVRPETVEMPVLSSEDLVEIGHLDHGPVYVAKEAIDADLIFAVNRVKPHTDFHGPIESGLAKILAVGLGKQKGANAIHAGGPERLGHMAVAITDLLVGKGKVLAGLAVLETTQHEVADLVLVEAAGIGHAAESALLGQARERLARLPFDDLDVLVIAELGKEVSGAGIDPNVLGRMRIEGTPEPDSPNIAMVVVLGLSEATAGNATGIGLADLTTVRVLEGIDLSVTYLNSLTSGRGGLRRAALPIPLASDRDAICAALASCGQARPERRRLVHVKNTLSLSQFLASTTLRDEIEAHPELEIVDGPRAMRFDEAGKLLDVAG